MSLTFRSLRRSLAPRWLTDGEGELAGLSLDAMKDAVAERLYEALQARLPSLAPADALALMGRDRRIVRGIFDTDAGYGARLIPWLDEWKSAGSPFALLRQLAAYCGPLPSFRTVDNRGNWHSRAVGGAETMLLKQGNWDWDGHPEKWSRFWVIIYPRGLWTSGPISWGAGGTWGAAGGVWGCDITPEQFTSLRHIISTWKPAGTRCVNIILAFDTASFDPSSAYHAAGMPDGLWGHWSKIVGGVRVPSRLGTARYLDGV